MNDLERRLRDTYPAALDGIDATDRLSEISVPSGSSARARQWRFSPAFAFGAAALATVLVVGGIAVFGSGGDSAISLVAAEETVHVSGGQTLTEIRFDDATVVAAGGIGGRPAVVVLTENGRAALRQMVAPAKWDEHPMEAWQSQRVLRGSGSDGDAFAIVLAEVPREDWFAVQVTTDGIAWETSGFAPSTATQAYGNAAAARSTNIEDVSVDGGRVTVLVRTDPQVDDAALETFLRERGDLAADQRIEQVEEWGPDGIQIRLTDGAAIRYELADLGIEPDWVNSAWEVWITLGDGSSRGIPLDGALYTPMRATDWQPETATSAGNSLYVGGSRDGVAVLEVSDLGTEVIERFAAVDLDELIDGSVSPLLAVTSLRTSEGVAVAGIVAPNTAVAVTLDGSARALWAFEGNNAAPVAEMAVRSDVVVSVGYPGVVVTSNDLYAAAPAVASVPTDFGIFDRHPTGLTLTDFGILAIPQAGTDPSSFGTDGSAWLIDLLAGG